MFVVDDATADTLRRIWQEQGELSAVVELRRHFPLIADNAKAQICLQAILGWTSRLDPEPKLEPSGIVNLATAGVGRRAKPDHRTR